MSKVSCFVARRPYPSRRQRSGCQRGFTLVELLIVVSIIVILISMIGLVFPGFREKLNVTKCQKNLRAIHGILQTYTAANDGWFPSFNDYWGTNISHPYKYDDGRIPEVTPWEAMSDVTQLKEMGASPDVFFCPFHPYYGDYEYWQLKSWEKPWTRHNDWHGYNYARVYFGYFFIINRGGRYGANSVHWLSDGRGPIRKDAAGEDDLPIVADLLHYRSEELKSGWWHGGGPGADEGLFNSSCNTLFFGGYVIYKEWKELEEQQAEGQPEDYGGYGTTSTSSDFRWFWLGQESEEY